MSDQVGYMRVKIAKVISILHLLLMIAVLTMSIFNGLDQSNSTAYLAGFWFGSAVIGFFLLYPHYLFQMIIRNKLTSARIRGIRLNIFAGVIMFLINLIISINAENSSWFWSAFIGLTLFGPYALNAYVLMYFTSDQSMTAEGQS